MPTKISPTVKTKAQQDHGPWLFLCALFLRKRWVSIRWLAIIVFKTRTHTSFVTGVWRPNYQRIDFGARVLSITGAKVIIFLNGTWAASFGWALMIRVNLGLAHMESVINPALAKIQ